MTLLDERRVEIETQARAEGMDLTRKKLEPVIERLTALCADMLALLDEMPVRHPQQAERRDVLRKAFETGAS